MLLPVTLSATAAAAIINVWLANRIGRLRIAHKVSVGDGGHDLLARRMRAQLNFAENVPLVLLLIAGIELAGRGGLWLEIVAALFMLARVGHALGMDGGALKRLRMVGIMTTFIVAIGLAGAAVAIAAGLF